MSDPAMARNDAYFNNNEEDIQSKAPSGAKFILVDNGEVTYFDHWVEVAVAQSKRAGSVIRDAGTNVRQLVAASASIEKLDA